MAGTSRFRVARWIARVASAVLCASLAHGAAISAGAHAPAALSSFGQVGDGSWLVADARTHRAFAPDPDGTVRVLDTRTGHLVRTVRVTSAATPPETPAGVTDVTPVVDELGGRVVVAVYGPGHGQSGVAVLDATTGRPLRPLIALPIPVSLVLDGATGRLFVGHGDAKRGTGSVSTVDPRTGHLLRRVDVGHYPGALIADGPGGHVFAGVLTPTVGPHAPATSQIPTLFYGGVVMLDARTGAVMRTVVSGPSVLGGPDRRGLVFAFDVGKPFATPQEDMVSIDGATGRVRGIVRFGSMESAPSVEGVAVDDRTGHLFVATGGEDGSDGTLTTIDVRAGRVLHAERIGAVPTAVALDAQTRRVFVAYWDQVDARHYGDERVIGAYGAGAVAVFDARTGRRIRTLTVDPGPNALALDAGARRLLVISQGAEGSGGFTAEPDAVASIAI